MMKRITIFAFFLCFSVLSQAVPISATEVSSFNAGAASGSGYVWDSASNETTWWFNFDKPLHHESIYGVYLSETKTFEPFTFSFESPKGFMGILETNLASLSDSYFYGSKGVRDSLAFSGTQEVQSHGKAVVTPIPEPSTYALMATGLVLLWTSRKRKEVNVWTDSHAWRKNGCVSTAVFLLSLQLLLHRVYINLFYL